MKTFGIITFHHYNNYGTMLQALALQQAIRQENESCELIDYKETAPVSRSSMLLLRLKRLPVYLFHLKKYATLWATRDRDAQRSALFEKFYTSYLSVSAQHYSSAQEMVLEPPKYDGYIVGSDQTWNPYVSNRSLGFYLPFVNDSRKKGSYAPSISISQCTQEQISFFQQYLSDFAFLSCREQCGADILTKALGRNVETVLDPTLLLSPEQWSAYAAPLETLPEEYILAYFLGDVAAHRKALFALQKQLSLPVVFLPFSYLDRANKNGQQSYVGPDQFLWLMEHAALVCTDSFHGTAFSINFHRDFYCFSKFQDKDRHSENSRLYNLLSLLHLEDRLVKDDSPLEASAIDYSAVDPLLDDARARSRTYLRTMLSSLG